jgi:hypothetical protein
MITYAGVIRRSLTWHRMQVGRMADGEWQLMTWSRSHTWAVILDVAEDEALTSSGPNVLRGRCRAQGGPCRTYLSHLPLIVVHDGRSWHPGDLV